MIFEQIRSATVILTYGNKKILIDPWLASKGALGSFNSLNMGMYSSFPEKNTIAMPMVDLPKTTDEILNDIDANLVTHIHPDHIDIMPDGTIGNLLNKNIPVFIRASEDIPVFLNSGFQDIRPLTDSGITFEGINIIRIPAWHGTNKLCGPACGIIFKCAGEPTIYLMGDTVWNDKIQDILQTFHPDLIIMNACAAELLDYGQLITGKKDVKKITEIAPYAKIIISHMDTVSHQTVSRAEMKEYLKQNNLLAKTLIPDDGESYLFRK